MTHSILGKGASDRQSVRRLSRQRRAVAASLLAGVVGTTGLAMAPANAVDKGPFYALEIFAPDHTPEVTATCGRLVPITGMKTPALLPAGTTASIVVIGPYNGSRKVGTCTVYTIGTVKVAAPAGHLVPKGLPAKGGLVKAVTAAKVTDSGRTKLVAEKVVDRRRPGGGAAAEVELAYVANFHVNEVGDSTWQVQDSAGDVHTLDVTAAAAGAEIEAGLGADSDIAAQFLTEEPAPE